MTDTPEIARIRANFYNDEDACNPASMAALLAHIDSYAAVLASISAELGLPPTIGPAPGALAGLLEPVKAQAAEINRLWATNMMRAPHGVEVIVTLAPVRKGAKSKVALATRWTENGRGHAGPAEWSAHDDQINTPIAWMKMPTPYVEALASEAKEKS